MGCRPASSPGHRGSNFPASPAPQGDPFPGQGAGQQGRGGHRGNAGYLVTQLVLGQSPVAKETKLQMASVLWPCFWKKVINYCSQYLSPDMTGPVCVHAQFWVSHYSLLGGRGRKKGVEKNNLMS